MTTYNVGDTAVSNLPAATGRDVNYNSAVEALAVVGDHVYTADPGNSTVAVVPIATLRRGYPYYTPATQVLITVGLFPEDLAATPDGSQVWVADTGPETGTNGETSGFPGAPGGQAGSPGPGGGGTIPFTALSVITTTSNKVVGTIQLDSAPQQIAFTPTGNTAYVTTQTGLVAIDVASRRIVGNLNGLDDPHGVVVSPDGTEIYVTDAGSGTVSVIDASTLRVTTTISVGQLPWTVILTKAGTTAYVANPDSDTVSVIDTTTEEVVGTIPVSGDPEPLALSTTGTTPRLWVGKAAFAEVEVIDTKTGADTDVGTIILYYEQKAQKGDGREPTGLAFVPATSSSGGSETTSS